MWYVAVEIEREHGLQSQIYSKSCKDSFTYACNQLKYIQYLQNMTENVFRSIKLRLPLRTSQRYCPENIALSLNFPEAWMSKMDFFLPVRRNGPWKACRMRWSLKYHRILPTEERLMPVFSLSNCLRHSIFPTMVWWGRSVRSYCLTPTWNSVGDDVLTKTILTCLSNGVCEAAG